MSTQLHEESGPGPANSTSAQVKAPTSGTHTNFTHKPGAVPDVSLALGGAPAAPQDGSAQLSGE